MPKIRNFSLPPDLTEALVEVLEVLPIDMLTEWGRECLPGGFTRPDMIRARVNAMVRGEGVIDPGLVKLLEVGLPYRETISFLSLAALQHCFEPLAGIMGRELLLLGLLVDPRDPVHEWAIEQVSRPVPPRPKEGPPEHAVQTMTAVIEERLVFPLEIELAPPESVQRPATDLLESFRKATVADFEAQIDSQKKSIERLNRELGRQKQRYLEKLKQQAAEADIEKKQLRAELEAARAQIAARDKDLGRLQARLDELSQRMEVTVAERLRAETSKLVRKWLGEPLETEAALETAQAKAHDLLAKADAVLEAQGRQDRHAGNRLELEKRLAALRETRERLLSALQNAVTPVAQLRPTIGELEAEIARLERLLGLAAPAPEVVSRLLAGINAAGTWEEVRSLSQMVDQMSEAGLLAGPEARRVYNALQRKFSLLQERARPFEGDNGWSLRDTLYRNKSALLLLDGHNILFSLQDVFGADYENGHPGPAARQRLTRMVERLAQNRPNLRVKLCFDGPDARSVPVSPNVSVEYSGGTGRDRADEMIVSRLLFKDLQSLDQKVFVVTDDRQIRQAILQTGAKFVRTDLFAVLLADFGCLC
jgi:hypothetical protein